MQLGECLVSKPNKFALEIAQWSDQDFAVISTYITEFQNSKIRVSGGFFATSKHGYLI